MCTLTLEDDFNYLGNPELPTQCLPSLPFGIYLKIPKYLAIR